MNAWITPDEASQDTRLIEIRVPDDTYLYACLLGCVLLLIDSANWEQVGALSAAEIAALFAPTVQDLIDLA